MSLTGSYEEWQHRDKNGVRWWRDTCIYKIVFWQCYPELASSPTSIFNILLSLCVPPHPLPPSDSSFYFIAGCLYTWLDSNLPCLKLPELSKGRAHDEIYWLLKVSWHHFPSFLLLNGHKPPDNNSYGVSLNACGHQHFSPLWIETPTSSSTE